MFPPKDNLELESSLFRHWYDVCFEPAHPITCSRYRVLGYTRQRIIECIIKSEEESYRQTLQISFLKFASEQGHIL